MKKSFILLAAVLAFAFSSCKKTETTTAETNTVTELKVEATAQNKINLQSVKAQPNATLRKLAFALLSPNERYLAWVDNLNTVSANFTPQQKALVKEIGTFLSPELFTTPSKSAKAFSEQWLLKAKSVFTYDQIRAIAFDLYGQSSASNSLAVNDVAKKQCNCNGGSLYSCDGTSFCPTDNTYGECENPTRWGCGFSWVWPCDHACVSGLVDLTKDYLNDNN